MEKKEILKYFFDRGTQIDKTALELLYNSPDIFRKIRETPIKKLPTIITHDFIIETTNNTKDTIKVLKKPHGNTQFSIDNILDFYKHRYEVSKQTLLKRGLTNLISINKISDKTNKFSLIGMVERIEDNRLDLEDNSGVYSFSIGPALKETLTEDDVIGVTCERDGNDIKIKEIVYPDIELKRDVIKTQAPENILFISNFHMDSKKFNKTFYKNFTAWLNKQEKLKIFVLGGISSNKTDIKNFLNDTSKHSVLFLKEDGVDYLNHTMIYPEPVFLDLHGIKVFLTFGEFILDYMTRWSTQLDKTLTTLIKKRNLNPLTNITENNVYFLDIVPDIIAIGGINKPTCLNYKGVTIVSNGSFLKEPIYWLMNLETRETFKIDFS